MTVLMLPEKKLTYINGILTLVDGKLNPCFFHDDPNRRNSEQKQERERQERERAKIFKETYWKLYRSVKRITITFKDGHIAVLDLKDKEYGWRIRWSTRDLLREAVIPKKLGFDEYGSTLKANEFSVERKALPPELNLTLAEKIERCHSRIPQMRHIEGFCDSGLIAPLPIWSPVPEKYRTSAHDDFSVWGLEAQDPKYLPEILKPFVYLKKIGEKGRDYGIFLLPGADKTAQLSNSCIAGDVDAEILGQDKVQTVTYKQAEKIHRKLRW